jgi:hypothetical protein
MHNARYFVPDIRGVVARVLVGSRRSSRILVLTLRRYLRRRSCITTLVTAKTRSTALGASGVERDSGVTSLILGTGASRTTIVLGLSILQRGAYSLPRSLLGISDGGNSNSLAALRLILAKDLETAL